MPGIGFGELVVVFLLLLIFVGPQRLPQVARTLGRMMGEVRRATDELKTALYLEDARGRRGNPTPPSPYKVARKGPRRDVESPDKAAPADGEKPTTPATAGDGTDADPPEKSGEGKADP